MAELIPAAMASIERALQPASTEDLAALMARLWKSGVPCPERDTQVEWLRLLAPYPAAVVAEAFDQLAKSYRWPHPPKVADAMRYIDPEMERRHAWRRKLKTAQLRAELDAKSPARPKISDEERAATIARLKDKFPGMFGLEG